MACSFTLPEPILVATVTRIILTTVTAGRNAGGCKGESVMWKVTIAVALFAATGMSALPASAYCLFNEKQLSEVIDTMPAGRHKEAAIREMMLAMFGPRPGDELLCLDSIKLCLSDAICPNPNPPGGSQVVG